ncbi:MAG: SAM-dependent methyltransferase [Halocynthiibacter sp.]
MRHYPVFLNTQTQHALVSGAGFAAVAKLRLLLKTELSIMVYGAQPSPEIQAWAGEGRLRLVARPLVEADFQTFELRSVALFYAANENHVEDSEVAGWAKNAGLLVNIVDNLRDSDFITPAIVDRAPVTVAIATEGAAPVLARNIKADLEESLSTDLGPLVEIARGYRLAAKAVPYGAPRRAFWAEFYNTVGPKAFRSGGKTAVEQALEALLKAHSANSAPDGKISFIGLGSGQPDDMTLAARKALHDADIVVANADVPQEILELARREAEFITVSDHGVFDQRFANQRALNAARSGQTIARIALGDVIDHAAFFDLRKAAEDDGLSTSWIRGISRLDDCFMRAELFPNYTIEEVAR